MKMINQIVSMLGVSNLRIKKKDEKPSVVKDVIKDPDSYKIEAFVENGEIVVKIKKKD